MKNYYKFSLFFFGLISVSLILINTPKYSSYKRQAVNNITNFFPSSKSKLNTNYKGSHKVTKPKYDLSHLTPEEYAITQNEGTEAPFTNKYWNNKEEGIYVDAISGKVLFSSKDKYNSGSGWPSFTKTINPDEIKTKVDSKLNATRTEIHSQSAKTHLGHVFDDGPQDKGGKRFCVNSAALKFIPLNEIKKKGYEQYLKLFKGLSATKDNKDTKATQSETATLAGGCFWGVEHLLKKLPGVLSAQSGYTGGTTKNPTYNSISTGLTSHAEAVQITFDPSKVSYTQVLSYFWRLHNPTEVNKQGPDVGTQYRSAIFYHSAKQKDLAEQSLIAFDKSGVFKKKVATKIIQASAFYPAETYHQDYYDKNPGRVCHALRDK